MRWPAAAGVVGVLALAKGVLAWAAFGAEWRDVALVAAIVAVAGGAVLASLRRTDLAVGVAATVAAAGSMHAAHTSALIAALLSLVFFAPRMGGKASEAAASAVVAGSAAFLVARRVEVAVAAAVAAAALTALRPAHPTDGFLKGLRTVALAVPALAMAVLLAFNAAVGLGDALAVRTALVWALGAFAFAVFASLAVLGLAVLLETTDARQGVVWAGLVAVACVAAAGAAVVRDPSRLVAVASVAVPLAAYAAAFAVARLGHAGRIPWWAAWAVPVALALAQFGLVTS